MIQDMVRTFAQKEVAPLAEKIDKESWFPDELIKKLSEIGLMGMNVDTEHGGSGMDYVSYTLLSEELGRADSSVHRLPALANRLAFVPLCPNR